MKIEEYLLICLAEECMEVSQRITKALRFGLNEIQTGQPYDNKDRIHEELDDLFSLVKILNDNEILDYQYPEQSKKEKFEKIKKYLDISVKEGTISQKEVDRLVYHH